MATHSSILAWRIPWTEEPGMLQPMGLQRVGHDWATFTSLTSVQEGLFGHDTLLLQQYFFSLLRRKKKKEQKIADILSGSYGRERCPGLNCVPPNSYVDCILSDPSIWPYLETGPLKTSPWKRQLRLNEVRWGPYSNLIGVLVRREHLDRKETAETRAEKRPREDTVRRQPSASQEEKPQKKSDTLTPWSWTSSLQTVIKLTSVVLATWSAVFCYGRLSKHSGVREKEATG